MPDERPLINPSVADMVFALMSAPGFNDPGEQPVPRRTWLQSAFRAPGARQQAPSRRVQGINVLVWGPAGYGKTSLITHVARELDRRLFEMVLSQYAPEDIGGLPRIVKEDGQQFTRRIPSEELMRIHRMRHSALLLDDMTNASQQTQAATLKLVLNREFSDGAGGMLSIRHCPIVAAANHGDAAALSPLLAPDANRFVHLFVDPGTDSLQYWLSGGKPQLHVDKRRARTIDAEWDVRYARAWTLVSSYIREYRRGAFDAEPQDFATVESHAWGTSRSWELAARSIAAAEHYGIDDQRLIEGAVGRRQARQFLDYRRLLELPTVEDVFAGRVDWAETKPSSTVLLLHDASVRARNDRQVGALLDACGVVRRLNQGSDDLLVPARDMLLYRSGPTAPAAQRLGAAQAARVRGAFPRAQLPAAVSGPDQQQLAG